MQEFFTGLFNDYPQWVYLIVFLWCILEGELALILAGIAAHAGGVNLGLIIFVAGLGGFCGDQIYFYIGRYNKKYIQKKLSSQRTKFAIAHLLLEKYGWPVIFVQRYLYGLRTVIPMSIGITRYNALKFAFINLISAWVWAAITILLAWYFGGAIWKAIHWIEGHWYIGVPLLLCIAGGVLYAFKSIENRVLRKREMRKNENRNK